MKVVKVIFIIKHLPETIECDGLVYHLNLSKKNVFYCSKDSKIAFASMYDMLLESTYQTLVWYLKWRNA